MTEGKYKRGDEVRAIRDVAASVDTMSMRAGEKFIVDDYVSADESGDGFAFYWLNHLGGRGNTWAFEDDLTLSRTREELANRKLPTRQEFAGHLGSTIGQFYELDIDESDVDGSRVYFYGTTPEGLRFGVAVDVTEIHETDY